MHFFYFAPTIDTQPHTKKPMETLQHPNPKVQSCYPYYKQTTEIPNTIV